MLRMSQKASDNWQQVARHLLVFERQSWQCRGSACVQSDYSIYILLTQSMNLAKMCLRREYLRIRVGLRNEMEAKLTNLSEVRSTT